MADFKIPSAIVKLLQDADFMCLATSGEDGHPCAANKFLLKIEGDILYIVDFVKGKTWKNLQYNPFMSITVMDKDNLRDYQINGTAEILEKGFVHARLMEEFSEKQIRFATNRVIEGVKRNKVHASFAFPIPEKAIVLKVKVDEVIEMGPTAALRRDKGVLFDEKSGSLVSGVSSHLLKKTKYYLSKNPRLTFLSGLFLVLLIGAVDYWTGYEVGVSIFYVFPIVMVTWGRGQRDGLFIALASVVAWFVAEALARGITFPLVIVLWNAAIRWGFFSIITYLLYSLKVRLEKEERLASHDFLTGAANSRYFFELTEREMKRMLRGKSIFTLTYLDVDDFKRINDANGHRAGDAMLQLIADTIKNSIREIDVVARLGGDEFAILMPLTDDEGARMIIRRIRERLMDTTQQHKQNVTFSMGAVTYFYPPATVDEVISLADSQMYIAKKAGKNIIKYAVFDERGLCEP